MWQIILVLIFGPIILWILHWFYWVIHYDKYLKSIPGRWGLPILGSALEFNGPTTFLSTLMFNYKRYKGNFRGYMGSHPCLVVCEPKDLEIFLNSTKILTKTWNYKFMHKWLGTGLLTSTGDKWRKHRKILTPAFHFQILEEYIDIFNSASDILISKLEIQSNKDFVNIYPFITRLTLDIICESAMGTSVNAQQDHDSEYVRSVNILLDIVIKRTFSPILHSDLIYRFTPTYRKERDALKVVHGFTKFVLNCRKDKFRNNYDNLLETSNFEGVKKKRAFLDLMLEYSSSDPNFTEDDICQEINTFMFEGHDTTATSIAFALHSLASYPDIQRKAYAELEMIFSDDPKRNSTYRDLLHMKYLEMVIKESLRIYATVPAYGRTLEEDFVWNGVKLPKGLMLVIFAYGVQSSDSFPKPEIFDPERFSAENTQKRHPFAYIPFSAGPRNCIGQKFAMLEMKSTISKVLRNFELLPSDPEHKIILQAAGVLKSANGVYIKLKRRN